MKFKDMNTPNKLTTLRMICVPVVIIVFVLFMFNRFGICETDYYIFSKRPEGPASSNYNVFYLSVDEIILAVLFALASITDFIDGKMARKLNIVTDYGKLMDPLADKLLVNSTLICMIASRMFAIGLVGRYNWFCVIVMALVVISIARDVFVDALRMQALKKGAVVPANIWGKLKTATLMPGVVIMFFASTCLPVFYIGTILITLGCVFSIIGGVKYFLSMIQYIGE